MKLEVYDDVYQKLVEYVRQMHPPAPVDVAGGPDGDGLDAGGLADGGDCAGGGAAGVCAVEDAGAVTWVLTLVEKELTTTLNDIVQRYLEQEEIWGTRWMEFLISTYVTRARHLV